uniref:Zinc finger, CCHC-type, retrotransposon Gag domain protein n=1 Tax=Tanacetum cinerariifolium TaxID=118510 RepID=A0A6L2JJN1_TANCI|nr:zinc finger, CCHC-type, retrotransposon Gag domain protein [Tanacetum cinerariifolium]
MLVDALLQHGVKGQVNRMVEKMRGLEIKQEAVEVDKGVAEVAKEVVEMAKEVIRVVREVVEGFSRQLSMSSSVRGGYKISNGSLLEILSCNFSSKKLWNICAQYGTVQDVYIPKKPSKQGKPLSFGHFNKVNDVDTESKPISFSQNSAPKEHVHGFGYTPLFAKVVKRKEVQECHDTPVMFPKRGLLNYEDRVVWIDVEGTPLQAWSHATFNTIASKWGELINMDVSNASNKYNMCLCVKTKNSPDHVEKSARRLKNSPCHMENSHVNMENSPEQLENSPDHVENSHVHMENSPEQIRSERLVGIASPDSRQDSRGVSYEFWTSDASGNPPPVTIHTWLECFNKQKPHSFEKATTPVDAENWISHMEKIFDVVENSETGSFKMINTLSNL